MLDAGSVALTEMGRFTFSCEVDETGEFLASCVVESRRVLEPGAHERALLLTEKIALVRLLGRPCSQLFGGLEGDGELLLSQLVVPTRVTQRLLCIANVGDGVPALGDHDIERRPEVVGVVVDIGIE